MSNDGTRTPLDLSGTIAEIYEEFADTVSEVPTRMIGEGCSDTSTQIAKIVKKADLKDEMDAVAYLEGRTVTESQGRIKAVQVMRDDFGADTPVAYYPIGSYDPITIGPGFTARTDEVFVQYGWNETTEEFEDERRYLNATSLEKLGGVGLNTTHQIDDRVARWITTEALADSVGRRIVNHLHSGLILWRIRAHIRNPALEIGDVVSITTDQFAGRNPITDEEIRGPLSALAIITRVGDFWGTDLDLWIPGYEYITVAEGTTTRTGFVAPQVSDLTYNFNTDAELIVSLRAIHAGSVKVAADGSAFPSAATVEAESAQALSSDGWVELNLGSGFPSSVYISAKAYELVDATGADSPLAVSRVFKVEHLVARTVQASHMFVGSFDNLVRDPGFEQGDLSQWQELSGTGGTWSRTTSNVRTGVGAVQYDPTGQTGRARLANSGDDSVASGDYIPCSEGDSFYMEAQVRKASTGTPNTAGVRLSFRDSSGTLVGSAADTVTPTTTYQKVSVAGTAPSGAQRVVLELAVENDGNGETIVFDDCYARRKVDGTIVTGTLEADVVHTGKLQRGGIEFGPLHIDGTDREVTGTTSETTLETITVPQGAMGSGGGVRIHAVVEYDGAGGSKTLRVKFGGSALTNFNLGFSTGRAELTGYIINQGSVDAQRAHFSWVRSLDDSFVTTFDSTVDTSAGDVDIDITGQLADTGDTIRLEVSIAELVAPTA